MTQNKSRRGCDLLLGALHSACISRIFTLSGNHIMPVFDAAFAARMPLIHTRPHGQTPRA